MSPQCAFTGKRVLVTGGARRAASIDAFRHELGGEAEVVAAPGPLEDRASCAAVVSDAVAGLGGLDILVNAAGVFEEVPFEAVTQAHWEATFAVNVAGTFFTLQAALPHLEAAGGNAVNLGSDAGLVGFPPSSVYSGAKAAVVNLTRALALELAGRIRVNCVCPGNVATEMIDAAAEASGDREAYLTAARQRAPLGRMARPEEVADAVLHLASPRAGFTHGAILSVDGGGVCGF